MALWALSSLYPSYAQKEEDKDFSYDNESKSIIPKYMGKVFLHKGNCKVKRKDNTEQELLKDSKIYPGDTIQTQKSSLIKIEMVDTTVLTIGPDSLFRLEDWVYKTKEDRKGTFHIIKGKMRSHFKVKAFEDGALKVKTGSISMGIRGTRVLAQNYDRGDKVLVHHVAVLTGKARVYDSIKDEKLDLEAGGQYISFVKSNGKVLKTIKTPLSANQIKYLRADDKNPNKYFRPFLKEFTSKNINQNKSAGDAAKAYGRSTYEKKSQRNPKSPQWQKTLNKLNNKLKSNE